MIGFVIILVEGEHKEFVGVSDSYDKVVDDLMALSRYYYGEDEAAQHMEWHYGESRPHKLWLPEDKGYLEVKQFEV